MTSTIQGQDTALRTKSYRAPSGRTAAAGPNRKSRNSQSPSGQGRNGSTRSSQTQSWARQQPPTPPSWEDLLGRR